MNGKPDFFISYTQSDRPWAEWIAWILEAADYHVVLQSWDFVPGCTWPERVDDIAQAEVRTIAILSPDYLGSPFAKAEWLAAWRTGAEGGQRKLVPVKVADCHTSGLLAGIATVDLVGLSEADAERELGTKIPAVIWDAPSLPAKPKFPGATRTLKRSLSSLDPTGRMRRPRLPVSAARDRVVTDGTPDFGTASVALARGDRSDSSLPWLSSSFFCALPVLSPVQPACGRPSANSPMTPESTGQLSPA